MQYLVGLHISALQLITTLFLHQGSEHGSRPAALTVHIFLNTECPISQQYCRTLTALEQQYGPNGVRFVAWFPLRTDSPRVIRQFRKEFRLLAPGKPDARAQMARRLHARVTPEVVVVQPDGQIRYQGAIDNGYVALGKHRPEVTQHYLHDALDALLADRPFLQARTEAVGCLIE